MASELNKNYADIFSRLKEKIRQARLQAIIIVNKQLIDLYWEIGNTILQQQKKEGWGTKVIDRLAADLKSEFPDMKGLSARNIKYMRAFAEAYPDFIFVQVPLAQIGSSSNTQIVQPMVAQLQNADNDRFKFVQPVAAQIPWTHHTILLDKLKTAEERFFYMKKIAENGWSKSVLVLQIESGLHKRQGKAITNFEHTLLKPQSDLAREMFKNPYLFDFLNLGEEAKERELENALIQHLKKFLLELGRGFAYVGNQYNIEVGGNDFFLDLLFYNTRLHCYVVFELKVGEFEPEFAGKLNFYLNTIDAQIKTPEDKPTIGILLCKTHNETVIEYALRGIDKPMGVADYELKKALPDILKTELPTVEELEKEIEKEIEGFKENLNPIDARLKVIKEKLKGIASDEIKTPATYPILLNLFKDGLKPLYQQIIEKMSAFDDEFHDKMFTWSSINKSIVNLEQLEEFWDNEEELRKVHVVSFTYALYGFKKAGTENYGEHLQLNFEIQNYWYGFTLVNYNNQQPFLKKLYHQQITKEDRQQIVDLMMTKVMDRIDWIINVMKEKK